MTRTHTILAALVLGTLAGIAIRWQAQPGLTTAAHALLPLGQMWVRALQMTLVPLIFAMITHGVGSAVASGQGSRLIGATFGLFLGAMVVTAAASTLLTETVLHFWPIPAGVLKGLVSADTPLPVPGLAEQLIAIIPANPVGAAASGQIFPLVVFGLVLGVAIARVPHNGPVDQSVLMRLLSEVTHAMLQIVEWVLVAAPVGVFVLALGLGLTSELGLVRVMAEYLVLSPTISMLMVALCYAAVRFAGAGPLDRFAEAIAPAQAMAAGSCSSLATSPVMIEVATGPLAIPEDVVGLTIPMAVSLFRVGTIANAIVSVLVATHAAGIAPGPLQLVLAGLAIILGSVSGAGLPGAAVIVAILTPGLQVLGAPLAIMPLYIAVVALVDPAITATNVTADLTAVVLVNRWLSRHSPAP